MPARLSSMELSTPNSEVPAGENRRRSGRVASRPGTYNETSPTTSSKRKRSNDDDNDVDMDDAESADDEIVDEGDGNGDRKARTGKKRNVKKPMGKPASKKAKTNGGTLNLPIRPVKEKARRPKKAKPFRDAAAEDAGGLFADVFAKQLPLEDVISEWLQRFQRHPSDAVSEIVNFLLRSAGCDLKVDHHDIEDEDGCTSKLTDIQDEYQAQNITEYPLIAKGSRAASFKTALTEFFTNFIEAIAQSEALFDNEDLILNVHIWFSTMSSAANRAFRHTATVASNAVMSGLCKVGKRLAESAAKSLRQSETERNKARPNKARAESFEKKSNEANEKRETLDHYLNDWFDTVFVHRYRDVDPRIRVDCVQALSDWTVTYSDLFFNGQHLRYLGWVLSDASAPTRLEVVRQLQRLYRDQDKIAGLKTFTERFRPRMVEMATSDADVAVRAASVELLDLLREAGLLEPDDIDMVGKLIFESESRVRKAVVPFFAEVINDLHETKIEELGGQDALEEALGSSEGAESVDLPRIEWLKLKCLVEILATYDSDEEALPPYMEKGPGGIGLLIVAAGIESRFTLAAQALYEHIEEIQEWEMIAGYLLFDNTQTGQNGASDDAEAQMKHECRLSEREELILLEVLNASVRLRLQQITDSTGDKKVKRSKAQREEMLHLQEATSRQLATLIPRLLKRFGATPETASTVLRLVHGLGQDVFQELQQDSATVSSLLDDINKQFMTHGAEDVLTGASSALLHAKSFEELGEVTQNKLQGLLEDTISTLHALHRGRDFSKRGNLSLNVLSAVSNTVLRIANLAGITDCSEHLESTQLVGTKKSSKLSDAPITLLLALLARGVPSSDISPEIAEAEDSLTMRTTKAVLFYFMWKVRTITDSINASGPISDNVLDPIAMRRDSAVTSLIRVIESRRGADPIRLNAAGTLLDIYSSLATLRLVKMDQKKTSSRSAVSGDNPSHDYPALALVLDSKTQGLLLRLLVAAETAYAKKTRRTLETSTSRGSSPALSADPADSDAHADDPMSESDSEDGSTIHVAAGGVDSDASLRAALEAEQALCEYAGKLVFGIMAGILEDKSESGQGKLRRALEKNRTRLGPNYKEVVAFLDANKMNKRARAKAGTAKQKQTQKPNDTRKNTAKASKSKETVVISEDEEESDDGDEDTSHAEQDDEAVLGSRDDENETDHVENGEENAQEEDHESVVGD